MHDSETRALRRTALILLAVSALRLMWPSGSAAPVAGVATDSHVVPWTSHDRTNGPQASLCILDYSRVRGLRGDLRCRHDVYETRAIGRPVSGAILGICLAFGEHSSFAEWLGRLPFTIALLAKTATHMIVLTFTVLSVGVLSGNITLGSGTPEPQLFTQPEFYLPLGMTLSLYSVIIFFRQPGTGSACQGPPRAVSPP
jgi:hypothetical protein